MRKVLRVLVLAALLVLGLSLPAWALDWTEPPDKIPSIFGNREYTRQHWVDFYVNESMVRANQYSPGSRLLFSGHCSVFDIPGNLESGYTAVGSKDGAYWKASLYLSALGVPNIDGYWIISPAYWREHSTLGGTAAPFTGSGEMIFDVPVTTIRDSSGLNPNRDTIQKPKCFSNGPDGFHAGGYYSSTGYHWFSQGQRSPVGLTRECASNLWKEDRTTRAAICYSYIYGLTVSGLEPVGSPSDGSQTWKMTVFNTTPYIAKNVKLRAYLVHSGKCELAANTTTDIGPVLLGNGRGGIMQPAVSWNLGSDVQQSGTLYNTVTWTFDVPVPSDDYKVLVSANVLFDGSEGYPEPLTTIVAYGRNASNVVGLTGTKPETAPYFRPPGHVVYTVGGADAYLDNYAESNEQAGWSPPDDGGGNQNDRPNNLAVINLKLFRVNEQGEEEPVSGTVEVNKPYRVKATFNSTFDFSGWAKVRFYVKREAGWMDLRKEENVYFEPGGTVQKTWNWTGMSENVKLIATVAYRWWEQQSKWKEEPFEGKTEATYDDNKRELSTAGTDIPKGPPTPGRWSYPLYYHPMKWKEVPVYEEYTEDVYGWKKVPFVKEEGEEKVRVRLVPNN